MTKKNKSEIGKLKGKIHGLAKEFKEMTEGITIDIKTALNSKTMKKIRKYYSRICDLKEIEKILVEANRLRASYVALIFRTGYIKDEATRRKLDKIPLTLGEIIKEYSSKS